MFSKKSIMALVVAFLMPLSFAWAQQGQKGDMQGQKGQQYGTDQGTRSPQADVEREPGGTAMREGETRGTEPKAGDDIETGISKSGSKVIDAETLKDKEVKGRQGEDFGKVEDVVLDDKGQVLYVVVNRGGLLGVGGSSYAVPWEAFSMTPEGNLTLKMSAQQMENAPKLDGDVKTAMKNPEWENKIHSFYGLKPGERSATGQMK